MKIFAPKYYNEFKCSASLCSHSCCIGWEIDVDEKSIAKYSSSKSPYAKEIVKSIKQKPTPHFKLLKEDRCPHLDSDRLCKIITNLGEDMLCDICREHPRFYNETPFGVEVGLGLSCEEACRLILSSDDFTQIEEIGRDEYEIEDFGFNPISDRDYILSVLASNQPHQNKLDTIYKKYDASPEIISDEKWKTVILSLEYLNSEHKSLFLNYSSSILNDCRLDVFSTRILAYFIYRHVTKAKSKKELNAYVGLCAFLERLFFSVASSKNATEIDELIPLAVTLSEEIEYSEDNTEEIFAVFYQ